jgi:hypothetical protein
MGGHAATEDRRQVVDTIPTLAWPARPYGSAEFHNQQSKLWTRDGRLRFIQTTGHEFWEHSVKH